MLRTLSFVLTLSQLIACVPDAKRDVKSQNTNVLMIGTFRSSGQSTDIYFGNSEAPLITTNASGSYRIEIPRSLIDQSDDRHLYFYSSNGEAGSSPEIKEFESGVKTIETVFLGPTLEAQGTVKAMENGVEAPASGATLNIGRMKAVTDSQGRYTIYLPQNSLLPVKVQKKGYVITRATWQTSDIAEERPFTLHTKLEPEGRVTVPVRQRLIETSETRVPLYIETTPSALFVRISIAPFTTSPELDTSWISLKETVTLKASDLKQPTLYYQFAGEDKKQVSPISSLALSSELQTVSQ